MRQNSWPALIIVLVVVSFALFSFALSSNVSFSTIQAITGTDPEATTGDTLIFLSSDGTVAITGSASADTLDFSATASGSAGIRYDQIQDESSNLTQRRILNFLGAGVTCVDDAVDSSDCTIPGGGGNIFETMDAPAGTDPVADSATDTLLFLSTNSSISITGSAAADSLDFVVNEANLTVYTTVQDESGGLTQRRILNFLGAGVSCVDDGSNSTDCTISGGGSGLAVEEDDSGVAAAATTLDFGAGFDVSESPANEANITFDILEVGLTNDNIWIGSSGNLAVESGLPNCVDTSGQHLNYTQATNTVSCGTTEGESQLLFFTMNAPSGTNPQADTPTDTLNFTVVGSDITITGNSTTDTLEFNLNTPAGTNITADLEEETHANEHNIGGSDEVTFYGLIDDEGTPLTARRTLNFIGAGVSCVDDGAGAETDCTISGAASQNLFETMDAPFGTNPVADTTTDILIFQSVDGTVSISGSASADSLDFSAIDLNCVDCIGTVEISDDYILNSGDTITGDLFVQDGNGIIVGHSAQIDFGAISEFQILGTGTPDSSMGFARFQDNTSGPDVRFLKSRGVTIGAATIVQDGDTLGRFRFQGADGTDFNTTGAEILAEVDGSPALNDIPAAIVFRTRQDGGALSERLRIDNTGELTLNSNSLIFGLGTATNPTLTFNTDEVGDDTLLFDAATDNRFELSNSLDVVGVLTESGSPILTTIKDEDSVLTRRRLLNFTGGGVSCIDDTVDTIDCTISGGGSTNAFETVTPITGSAPVAEVSNDILTLLSTDGTIGITGSAAADSLDFFVNQSSLIFYSTVQDESSNLTQRRLLNFLGAGVTCIDDAVDSTDCTFGINAEENSSVVVTDVAAFDFLDPFDVVNSAGDAQISFDFTELEDVTWGNSTAPNIIITFNPSGAVNPAIRVDDGDFRLDDADFFVTDLVNCDVIFTNVTGKLLCGPSAADDSLLLGDGTNYFITAIGDCDDSGGNHLNYDTATNAFSCGTGAGYDLIQDEGSSLTQRSTIDFIGAGVTCSDVASETQCTIAGGASQNLFLTMDAPLGTDPAADSATDTLQFLSTLGTISITGSAAGDSLDFNVDVANLNFYSTVKDEDVLLTQRRFLNFTGAGISCTDDAVDTTDCAISGGGSTLAFETITAITGTDPVADVSNDTLLLQSTDGTIGITGSAAADSLDFFVNQSSLIFYSTVQDEGSGLVQRRILNFLGAGVNCVDDTVDSTDCTISGGGSTLAFETMNTPLGTNPVAEISNDTLNFDSPQGTVSITGNASTDTISFDVLAVDISDHSNLAGGRSITLINDTLDADVELFTHTKCIWFEDPTAADDFKSIWRNSTANAFTITEIWAESDQTVNFDLQIDDGTPSDVNGIDISPAAGEAEETSLGGNTTLDVDEELDLAITSVSGTPTFVSICWTYTVND